MMYGTCQSVDLSGQVRRHGCHSLEHSSLSDTPEVWVLKYKGNKTSGMVLVILVNHFMYIPQTYLTFLNLRGFQEERPLPCLWQSSKDQWKYDGAVERNNCG